MGDPASAALSGDWSPGRRDDEVLPQDAAEHYNQALALIKEGRDQEAEAAFRLALAIRPDHAPALNNLGLVLLTRGETDQAIEAFRTAIGSRPQYARPYNNLGVAYLRLGRTDWAIAQFRRALLVDPEYPAARRNLGTALGRREREAGPFRDGKLARQALSADTAADLAGAGGWIGRLRRILGRRG